ncbi:putative F-box domain-containing protein [Helianthus annuus]|uniref:F-box domain-containing protein n=1 Tax=Helianthus annuus TaxID=4232 RepID=A0A9K3E114_HELAN|nr:putative F-box domain-containing protein [Helianthus annuus]KAJ0451484.1 putative F-box domain-containing protein [Helianthus annuus]KAJ0456017.1 putative F-box domain-containing protein [Helianthus annuus]KAJ0473362.1 putative F-box domain-containing protein [Helianthus annuus]KAJ0648946.1 putative F-box domain-containing protein [Helianthus annuus]
MSDHIPFEIQSEIMNMLPAKSLIRFRSVCKSWKSMIESSDFITGYSGQHQHLLVRYIDCEPDYVSIIVDDDTFPRQKVSVTVPQFVDMLKYYRTTGTSHGLLCLYNNRMAVIWNPSITKEAAVVLPNVPDNQIYGTVLGFWVCGETNDPKIVKINCLKYLWGVEDVAYIPWQVEVRGFRKTIVGVRGFRKTSEPLIDFQTHPSSASIFAAYEPYSKSISNVWTDGRDSSYFVYSYVETLLLL